MDSSQIAQTIELILQDPIFKNLKPDDFKLCFNRMKKGHYGKSYDRIDGQIIFECLGAYCDERLSEAEKTSISAHSEIKAEKVDPKEINPEGQAKVIQALKDGMNLAKTKEPEIKERAVKIIKKSDRDKFIQACFTEHYQIWLKKPHVFLPDGKVVPGTIKGSEPSGRYIMYNGKICDDVEYVSEKLKEYDQENKQLTI